MLHTPVSSIIATRNGTTALTAMVELARMPRDNGSYRVEWSEARRNKGVSSGHAKGMKDLDRGWKEKTKAAHAAADVVDSDLAGIAWLVTEGARTASHGDTMRTPDTLVMRVAKPRVHPYLQRLRRIVTRTSSSAIMIQLHAIIHILHKFGYRFSRFCGWTHRVMGTHASASFQR